MCTRQRGGPVERIGNLWNDPHLCLLQPCRPGHQNFARGISLMVPVVCPSVFLRLGMRVWFEPSIVIRHHWTSTGRSEQRIHARHARNEQWSAWMRCPLPWLPLVAASRAFSQFRYACSRGWPWVWREPLWWFSALRG